MNLSPAPPIESLDPVEAFSSPTAPTERRAHARRSASGRCTILRQDAAFAADLVDLSADGAGLWSAIPLQSSEPVELALPARRLVAIQTAAVVSDVRRLDAETWRIGLSFRRRLQPEELAAALD